jgi:hypothetical protein
LVKIVRLEKGQSPPSGRKALIVDVGGPRARESIDDSPKRMIMRVPSTEYPRLIASLAEQMKDHANSVIYVKGAPN